MKALLQPSTVQLLRIPFSFFLMPVYFFALSQITDIHIIHSVVIFFLLHIVLYPASNAYNSYMDRDTESIGGVKNPKQPTRQLYRLSVVLDAAAVIMAFFISIYFMAGIVLFIAASKAYSYRGIRLKKYGIIAFIVAAVFQGGVIYFIVCHGCSIRQTLNISTPAMLASSFLVGSIYPLTQIYQHRQDAADNVNTISMMLGYRGTFFLSAISFFMGMMLMGYYFAANLELDRFLVFLPFMIPVMIYFFWWFAKVWKNTAAANFKNALRMNIIAAACTGAGFITLLLIENS